MITYNQHINELKKIFKITDSEQEASIKRWYSQGAQKIKMKIRRQVSAEKIYCDLEQGEASYQLPEYAGRVYGVKYNKPGSEYPLEEISSSYKWQQLTGNGNQTGVPQYYMLVSDDEVELYPKPSEDITEGLEITCSFKAPRYTADDVTTGTCTVSNNSEVVTFSDSIVSSNMVGRFFSTTDGTHEHFYRITEYVSNTSFKIENYYAGDSGSGRTFIIGDVVDIPEDYLDMVELYVAAKFVSMYRKNRKQGNDMMAEFKMELKEMNRDYANNSKTRVVKASRRRAMDSPYPRWWPMEGLSE